MRFQQFVTIDFYLAARRNRTWRVHAFSAQVWQKLGSKVALQGACAVTACLSVVTYNCELSTHQWETTLHFQQLRLLLYENKISIRNMKDEQNKVAKPTAFHKSGIWWGVDGACWSMRRRKWRHQTREQHWPGWRHCGRAEVNPSGAQLSKSDATSFINERRKLNLQQSTHARTPPLLMSTRNESNSEKRSTGLEMTTTQHQPNSHQLVII